jgi:CheY-like chemotaxis protein
MSLVPAPDKARSERSPTLEAEEVFHKLRILIVEDDNHLRTVVRMVLENGGYEVSEASNGREALELMATVPVALVIADMKMPIMTGAEMAVRIRSDPATLNVPILIMSGYADQVDCGASAWLHKPFEANHLLAIAASLIKSGQP